MSAKIVLLIFFASFLSVGLDFTKVHRKYKEYIFNVFCVVLILFSSTKTPETCYDTNNYVLFYNSVPSIGNFVPYILGYEPGWELLCIFFNAFGLNYHFYFFFLSAVSILIYRFIILKNCKNIFISLFTYISCFYFLNEIIVLRHGLASSLILLEIYYLSKNQKKRALLCVLLAFSFHTVGIFGLLPFFVKNEKISYRLFILIPLAFFINDKVFIKFLGSLGDLSANNVLSMVSVKVNNYLEKEHSAGGIKTVIIYSISFLMTFIVLFNHKKQNPFLRETSLYMILSAYFMIAFSAIASFGRINQLFLISNIPQSSFYLEEYKKKKTEFIIIPIFIAENFYIFFRQNFMNSGGNIFH